MKPPVFYVTKCKLFVADSEQIPPVALLGCFGKVKGSGNHNFIVGDHHLVMRNGMRGIDLGRNAGIGKSRRDAFPKEPFGSAKVGGGILFGPLTFIQ